MCFPVVVVTVAVVVVSVPAKTIIRTAATVTRMMVMMHIIFCTDGSIVIKW